MERDGWCQAGGQLTSDSDAEPELNGGLLPGEPSDSSEDGDAPAAALLFSDSGGSSDDASALGSNLSEEEEEEDDDDEFELLPSERKAQKLDQSR